MYTYKFLDDVKFGIRHDKNELYTSNPEIVVSAPVLPKKIINSTKVTLFPYDHGDINCAPSNIICSAAYFKIKINEKTSFFGNRKVILPSRLYNYNLARIMEDSRLSEESGCMTETCLNVLCKYGLGDEIVFRYDRSNINKLPLFLNNSLKGQFRYKKLQLDLCTIKFHLSQCNPVILSIVMPDYMKILDKGLLVKPCMLSENSSIKPFISNDKDIVNEKHSAHTVLLLDSDDDKEMFKFLNCWGLNWGDSGYGYIMYNYALDSNLVGDVYTLLMDV